MSIKLRVGGKYRMKNFPEPYEYVLIIGKEKDLGVHIHSYMGNNCEQFSGVIIYKDTLGSVNRRPDLCVWGENGEWDAAFLDDTNAITEELK